MEWIKCNEQLPPEGVIVGTVIDDANGRRNEQTLKRQGSLWFMPDNSMYVYYSPTHWRPATREELESDAKKIRGDVAHLETQLDSINKQIEQEEQR